MLRTLKAASAASLYQYKREVMVSRTVRSLNQYKRPSEYAENVESSVCCIAVSIQARSDGDGETVRSLYQYKRAVNDDGGQLCQVRSDPEVTAGVSKRGTKVRCLVAVRSLYQYKRPVGDDSGRRRWADEKITE